MSLYVNERFVITSTYYVSNYSRFFLRHTEQMIPFFSFYFLSVDVTKLHGRLHSTCTSLITLRLTLHRVLLDVAERKQTKRRANEGK